MRLCTEPDVHNLIPLMFSRWGYGCIDIGDTHDGLSHTLCYKVMEVFNGIDALAMVVW